MGKFPLSEVPRRGNLPARRKGSSPRQSGAGEVPHGWAREPPCDWAQGTSPPLPAGNFPAVSAGGFPAGTWGTSLRGQRGGQIKTCFLIRALSIGFFQVLPPSACTVVSAASNFLLKWLFQYEHEHRQWSAAVSLGLVSNCLHTTDRTQKIEIANALIKVIYKSASYLVKGACGLGLGFACEHLLIQGHNDSLPEGRLAEAKLLGKIIKSLTVIISQLCPSSSNFLISFCENFPLDVDDEQAEEFVDLSGYGSSELDDSWGVAGLIIGLANTAAALYRVGAYDAVLNIKDILMSYIPLSDSSSQGFSDGKPEIPLSMGSCLALPTLVTFCQRVELADINLPDLLSGYRSFMSELLATKYSGTSHQNLLMASSIGAGSLLSCILNEGVFSVKFDDVKCLLDVIRSTYTEPHAPAVQLGGMFGVINVFGAGAGILTHMYRRPSLRIGDAQKDLLYIRGPMFADPALECLSTSLIQEIFVIAKESMDLQIRRNAAWAISFLRHWWWSEDTESVNDQHGDFARSDQESRSLSKDSLVWELYSWLHGSEMDAFPNANTVASVLRCLSKAPRLPSSSDWGAIVKHCMKFGAHLSVQSKMMDQEAKILREECVHFSLAHANSNNSLMTFLDELADGSRFNTLDLNLQCSLLQCLPDLMRVFSALRLEKLYSDLLGYLSSPSSLYMLYNADQRCLLRISFWKGLHHCLVKVFDKLLSVSEAEKCIELLLSLLPAFIFTYDSIKKAQLQQELTWAVDCLSKAPEVWRMHVLQVPKMAFINWQNHAEVANKIIITSRLIAKGCLPMSELGKLKACILNSSSEGALSILMEIVGALYGADSSTKRQWLLDSVEISCISQHPSTALQFVGLLSSRCCEYMPLLLLDCDAVLSDLPVTLPSLLSDGSWSFIAEPLVANLWASTDRICKWALQLQSQEEDTGGVDIDASENRRPLVTGSGVSGTSCQCQLMTMNDILTVSIKASPNVRDTILTSKVTAQQLRMQQMIRMVSKSLNSSCFQRKVMALELVRYLAWFCLESQAISGGCHLRYLS
ncbi:hypothetical protein Taro_010956 [Colocasia esculenta]|uniref:Protein RST1 n=1 Tax=Colocasia esculenta TaxID=4460 RepID=A0A843U8Y3_COLES|nr:hypothetical protein [Colocasia esculenta]